MRLTGSLLLQQAGDRYVLVDESIGAEVAMSRTAALRVAHLISRWSADPQLAGVELQGEGETIELSPTVAHLVEEGLHYFLGYPGIPSDGQPPLVRFSARWQL